MLGLESTSSRMGNLARQELYFKRFFSLDEMLERIEDVTAEEVQKLAQQFFDPKQMAVAMLGRLEGFRVCPPGSGENVNGAVPGLPRNVSQTSVLARNAGVAATHACALDTSKLKPTGYVNDFAHVLDPGGQQRLEAYCANLERVTGAQMAIVLVPTLDGEPDRRRRESLIQGMGHRQEGQGRRHSDSAGGQGSQGAAEIGYGLEGDIPDGYAGGVLRGIRPILRQGNYAGALLAAAQQFGSRIAQAKGVQLGSAPPPASYVPAEPKGIPWPIIIIGLIILFAVLRGGGGGGFLTGIILGNLLGGGRGNDRWGGGGFGGGGGGGGFGGFGGGSSGGGGASSDW